VRRQPRPPFDRGARHHPLHTPRPIRHGRA
jgi:hypothetical protein